MHADREEAMQVERTYRRFDISARCRRCRTTARSRPPT
ncbi:hypothetical protein BURMUCF2_B0095 [Burkholderia multivorans CF2]|nr:hypothetical protein BURMUCF2_B0095 [Burkholderia multivorans CF2]